MASSSSLTAAPVKRILSLEWRCRRTTEAVRHFYQKALKSSGKPQVRTEDQEDHFCHSGSVQISNTQGLLQRSCVLLQTPHTASQDGEVVIVDFGAVSHLQHPQGLRLAHPSRSKIYLAHIIKLLHPLGCSSCHLHRPFPSHRWAGRRCEEDYPQRYPQTALPRDQQTINWL